MTSSLQGVRNARLMDRANLRARGGASAISSLVTEIGLMREIALKAHKNTSGDVDADMLAKLQSYLDEAIVGLPQCIAELEEMAQLRANPAIVDTLIAKYNFNESDYDDGLERGQ